MPIISLDKIKTSLINTGRYWIVFTGDSLTSCEWVHPNWRDIIIYVLSNEITGLSANGKPIEWGIKGFNFAYDGATTEDILNHADDIPLLKPQLVIGLMGANDPVMGISVNKSIENITKISYLINQSGSQIICVIQPQQTILL